MLILKQLRRKKNISQSALADAIDVSLRTIQLYERENANIPIKNLTKIAAYFDMGIDQLYAQEVNESDFVYKDRSADLKRAHTIQKLGPGKYLLLAPLVLGNEQKAYLNNFNDLSYLNTLPKVGFVVDQVSIGKYVAFEILNNSMDNGKPNRIPQKSIVLGKKLSGKKLPKKIKGDSSQWILICETGIMCKEITDYNAKTKSVFCHNLNDSPEYPDFEIQTKDVSAFYKIIKKQVD